MERGSAPRVVIFNADDGVGARCLDEGPGEPGVDEELETTADKAKLSLVCTHTVSSPGQASPSHFWCTFGQ